MAEGALAWLFAIAGTARFVADEFEARALTRAGVMNFWCDSTLTRRLAWARGHGNGTPEFARWTSDRKSGATVVIWRSD